ncbi:MAG: PhoX family protein [Magnetovibrionaceae bacterium]
MTQMERATNLIEEVVHDDDDLPSNPSTGPTFGDVVAARFSRRDTLKGMSAVAAVAAIGSAGFLGAKPAEAVGVGASSLGFKELPHGLDETHHVADGYEAQVMMRWGDAVEAGAPAFDPYKQTAAAQSKQFGYNNDFVGFFPLPLGSQNSDHGLLVVNHEYVDPEIMFPGYDKDNVPKEWVDVQMAAHGASVIEIKFMDGTWGIVEGSKYNRRITALDTEMELTGPAAGHDRLKTNADATGTKVIGTINNCAGGWTPWGTVLIAEENFHGYFGGDPTKTSEAENYKRYGLKGKARYPWFIHHARFDVDQEPNEPNRFGWMVEFDPYDPTSKPKKRTGLGRFKHEGATTIVNKDGRVVAYTGDDQRFDYVYRFVSDGKVTGDRAKDMDLLDNGVLSVGRFDADGTLAWLPLVFGQGPLTEENGFKSQADVLIETRKAADLLGATPMDRPEDVEPNPTTGVVYMALTNNTKRKPEQVDAANPRAKNKHGHIIEMIPPGASVGGKAEDADHSADTYTWDIFLKGGNPAKPEDGSMYPAGVTENGWVTTPDNVGFDPLGRLWIYSDGAPKSGIADGIWGADVSGPGRAITRHFYRTPIGAECCGPCFTPDGSTLFAAVQHPGDNKGSTFENPSTRWPDFDAKMPPRPSLVAIVKKGGGMIGS